MRIIVNESQYNKILIKEKENTPTFDNWVNYMGDILATHIHQFNVKEDVNTHTNLSNKLRGKTFFKELPIENFIINLVENIHREEIKISFNPYWSLLVETPDNFILKDIELDIELPNRKINGINEINIIKNQLHKEFIKINRWYNSYNLLNEQFYTLDPGVDLITNKMDDDASALDLFFLAVINKNIHILDADINNLRIRDDFTTSEKQKLQDAAVKEDPPINMVFDNGEIKLSYNDNIISPTTVMDNSVEDYYNKLRREGVFFINYEEEVIKFSLSEPYSNDGNTSTDVPSELPVFDNKNSIPNKAKDILKYVVTKSNAGEYSCKYDVLVLEDPTDPNSIQYSDAATKENRYWRVASECLPTFEVKFTDKTITLIAKKVAAHCKSSSNGCLNWENPEQLVKIGTFKDKSGKKRKEGCNEDNNVFSLFYLFGCETHPYGENAYLQPKAAQSFKEMNEAYNDGDIPIEGAYKDYFHQGVEGLEKGTSNYGYGLALNISNKKAKEWIKENGDKYGWYSPNISADPNQIIYTGKKSESPNENVNYTNLTFSSRSQKDLDDGIVNTNLLESLNQAAKNLGYIVYIGTAKRGHSPKTISGRNSRHQVGNAVDISAINKVSSGKSGKKYTKYYRKALALDKKGKKEEAKKYYKLATENDDRVLNTSFLNLGNAFVEELKKPPFNFRFGEGKNHRGYIWQSTVGGNHYNHIHTSNNQRPKK